jgi:CheY-like chemotaxis protein
VEQKKKVMIVDDEPFILRVLKMKLEQGGYTVTTALNGLEAMKKMDREQPSVVITDINMPQMNGRELCEILKKRQEKNPILIIVITSDIDKANRTWTEQMENTRFVVKPFSPRSILDMINNYFLEFQEV